MVMCASWICWVLLLGTPITISASSWKSAAAAREADGAHVDLAGGFHRQNHVLGISAGADADQGIARRPSVSTCRANTPSNPKSLV